VRLEHDHGAHLSASFVLHQRRQTQLDAFGAAGVQQLDRAGARSAVSQSWQVPAKIAVAYLHRGQWDRMFSAQQPGGIIDVLPEDLIELPC